MWVDFRRKKKCFVVCWFVFVFLSDRESADADEAAAPLHHSGGKNEGKGVTTEMEWKGDEYYKGKSREGKIEMF